MGVLFLLCLSGLLEGVIPFKRNSDIHHICFRLLLIQNNQVWSERSSISWYRLLHQLDALGCWDGPRQTVENLVMPVTDQAHIWGTMVQHVGKGLLLLMASRAAGVDNGFARPPSNRTGGEEVKPRFEGKPVLRKGGISPPSDPVIAGLVGRYTGCSSTLVFGQYLLGQVLFL